jgi:hypothetical protein
MMKDGPRLVAPDGRPIESKDRRLLGLSAEELRTRLSGLPKEFLEAEIAEIDMVVTMLEHRRGHLLGVIGDMRRLRSKYFAEKVRKESQK